jgi:RNA polymerase sigma-70 factor (ECF subfamily)
MELGRRFLNALARGDVPMLMEALDASAVLLSDGGGRVLAARQPIRGPDRIGRLVSALLAKRREPLTAKEVTVNGAVGLWREYPDGRPYAVVGLGFSEDGNRVTAIYVVLNPDKMRAPRISERTPAGASTRS